MPRLRRQPDVPINNDDPSNNDTSDQNITIRPRPRPGAMKVLESDIEDFDLEAVSSDESESLSDGQGPSRNPTFQKKLVRIRMTPVKPAPKSKPSYVELSDEEMPLTLTSAHQAPKPLNHGIPIVQQVVQQVVDGNDQRHMSSHETSKGKGKARAVMKRKTGPDIVEPRNGQMVQVRDTV